MLAGGSVTNEAGGLIDAISIAVVNVHDTVSNMGTITGLINISGGAGGSVINTTSGTISGGTIIAQTILNQGLIVGGIRNLISDASITNAASGTFANNAGYLSGLANYGVISGVTGAHVGVLTNAGTITGTGGTAVQAGELIIDPGAQFNGTVAGSALYLATGNGGTLAGFGTSIVNFGSITFETGAEWTIAGNTAGLSGVISGFAQADTIDLTGLSETVQDYTGGTLTLVGDKTVTLQLPGPFTKASFRTAPDAGTGTDVFLACFVVGTRIATDRGDVPVEHLRVGDHALTLGDGGSLVPRSVRWIGRRRIDLAQHPRPEAARPIRIRRGAFSEGVPDRDLLLSPDHAIYAEGVLIPVRWLVNERTVVPARRMRHVEYFHVELDQHAILLAEGMPAESYLDTGDRSTFENGGLAVELYPDFASRTWESGGCARLVVTGPEVEAVRQWLQRRANRNDPVVRTKAAAAW
jgi:Hint domain